MVFDEYAVDICNVIMLVSPRLAANLNEVAHYVHPRRACCWAMRGRDSRTRVYKDVFTTSQQQARRVVHIKSAVFAVIMYKDAACRGDKYVF
jgi:hypothetical protein